MKIEARTYRTVAERVGGKAVGSTAPVAWRIRTGGLWKSNIKDKLILAADFDEGFLTAVREGDWENTKAARRVRGVQSAVDDVGDEAGADRLQRVLCASVFEATLSGGRITIPREIVWLVQRDNDEHRDVTLVLLEPVLEIWPTRRWADYLAGPLFGKPS